MKRYKTIDAINKVDKGILNVAYINIKLLGEALGIHGIKEYRACYALNFFYITKHKYKDNYLGAVAIYKENEAIGYIDIDMNIDMENVEYKLYVINKDKGLRLKNYLTTQIVDYIDDDFKIIEEEALLDYRYIEHTVKHIGDWNYIWYKGKRIKQFIGIVDDYTIRIKTMDNNILDVSLDDIETLPHIIE